MHKVYTTLTVLGLAAGILDLVLNVYILTAVTHKNLTDSVGLTHPKVVVTQTVTPSATPTSTLTATPSGAMHNTLRVMTPSVSPVPSHVILKK